MQINNVQPTSEHAYFTKAFLDLIESHITYLKKLPKNQIISVTEHQCYKFEGDFYGLLNDLNIQKFLHYPILRMNGYDSSADFKDTIVSILVPEAEEIIRLKSALLTKK